MHRMLLHGLLTRYQPAAEFEITTKTRFLDFVANNPNCFARELLTGHVTASAWLLSNDLQQALLMHHAKLNIWCQLGGHCDGDSNVLNVAIKEAQEESGISHIIPINSEIFDLDIHSIPETKNTPVHYHYDVRFLLKVASNETASGNNESKALRWFTAHTDTLPTAEESVLRMQRKWHKFIS